MKIFIEVPTWLGDAIMTTPAIENIVNTFSKVKITIFGSFVSTILFKNHPNVERIIIDESKKSGLRYINLYNYAKSFGHFDKVISFRKNFTTKFLLYFINTTRNNNSNDIYIYRRYDKVYGTHQVIRYNDFINKSLNLNTTPNKLKIYKKNMENLPLFNNNKKLLGINPGATYGSAKRWYPTQFAKVAISLSNSYNIIIFGGNSEVEVANDIANDLRNNNVTNYKNLAGKTTVDQLINHISMLDLFITNDSGPMHIAGSFDINTVAIFGPTREKETHQWNNPNEIIIKKEFNCSPCMKRVCPIKDPKTNHQCMKEIKAKDVLIKLQNILI